jgi:hypothetical protein
MAKEHASLTSSTIEISFLTGAPPLAKMRYCLAKAWACRQTLSASANYSAYNLPPGSAGQAGTVKDVPHLNKERRRSSQTRREKTASHFVSQYA